MEDLFRTAFAHESVVGITSWGFWDGKHWRDGGGWWKKDWTPKKAALMYESLVFKKWWTDTVVVIPASGEAKIRAFYGDYTIGPKYKEDTYSFPIGSKTKTITVTGTVKLKQSIEESNHGIQKSGSKLFMPGKNVGKSSEFEARTYYSISGKWLNGINVNTPSVYLP